MSRKSREISPTGVYHVMLRGINRGRIFDDEQDCRKFVKILRQVTHPKDKDDAPLPPYCSIYAYCLMDNHIHLLIAEGTESLSNTMKRIGVAYVSYYNKRNERLGPLFHDRFRSEAVADAGYFINLLRYVHCNPVEAGIVEHPSQYQWSSWHEYDGSIKSNCVCNHTLPFTGMSRDEVCELMLNVSEKQSPQPRISQRRLTDTEATEILERICGEEPVLNMPKERQKNVVENAYAAGVGLRQLSRITKISYGAIVVMRRKSYSKTNNKPKEPSL